MNVVRRGHEAETEESSGEQKKRRHSPSASSSESDGDKNHQRRSSGGKEETQQMLDMTERLEDVPLFDLASCSSMQRLSMASKNICVFLLGLQLREADEEVLMKFVMFCLQRQRGIT